jgi:hypothetical protein
MSIIYPRRSAAKLPLQGASPPLTRGGLGRGLRQWSRHQNRIRNEPPQPPPCVRLRSLQGLRRIPLRGTSLRLSFRLRLQQGGRQPSCSSCRISSGPWVQLKVEKVKSITFQATRGRWPSPHPRHLGGVGAPAGAGVGVARRVVMVFSRNLPALRWVPPLLIAPVLVGCLAFTPKKGKLRLPFFAN